jgi:hypothetical protein
MLHCDYPEVRCTETPTDVIFYVDEPTSLSAYCAGHIVEMVHETRQCVGSDDEFVARPLTEEDSVAIRNRPAYGNCSRCGAIETSLNNVSGYRDLSGMGEHPWYPVGYGCELCD